jgi:hypothetical protein
MKKTIGILELSTALLFVSTYAQATSRICTLSSEALKIPITVSQVLNDKRARTQAIIEMGLDPKTTDTDNFSKETRGEYAQRIATLASTNSENSEALNRAEINKVLNDAKNFACPPDISTTALTEEQMRVRQSKLAEHFYKIKNVLTLGKANDPNVNFDKLLLGLTGELAHEIQSTGSALFSEAL